MITEFTPFFPQKVKRGKKEKAVFLFFFFNASNEKREEKDRWKKLYFKKNTIADRIYENEDYKKGEKRKTLR